MGQIMGMLSDQQGIDETLMLHGKLSELTTETVDCYCFQAFAACHRYSHGKSQYLEPEHADDQSSMERQIST
jgi:hypothetical protein